jgi:restriction endonuclease S subunit
VEKANFHFGWERGNEFRAQFYSGVHFPAYEPPFKAFVQAVPFNYFNKYQWYQVAFTWDDKSKTMNLYVNGIHIGKSDRFNSDFYRTKVNPALYTGAPALCHGGNTFTTKFFLMREIYTNYRHLPTI